MAIDFNSTINLTMPIIKPIADNVQVLVDTVKFLVGGMFGIYLILVFLRWKEARDLKNILKEIRDDIRILTDDIKFVNARVDGMDTKKKGKKKSK